MIEKSLFFKAIQNEHKDIHEPEQNTK